MKSYITEEDLEKMLENLPLQKVEDCFSDGIMLQIEQKELQRKRNNSVLLSMLGVLLTLIFLFAILASIGLLVPQDYGVLNINLKTFDVRNYSPNYTNWVYVFLTLAFFTGIAFAGRFLNYLKSTQSLK